MMRRKSSFLISFFATVGLCVLLFHLFDYLGIETFSVYDESVYMTETRYIPNGESTGQITLAGYYIFFLPVMLGWRLNCWMNTGKIHGNVKPKSHLALAILVSWNNRIHYYI